MAINEEIKLENIEQSSELFRLYLSRVENFIDELINNLDAILKKHETGEWANVPIFEAFTKKIYPPDESIKAWIELESIELFPFLLRESFFVMAYGYLEAFLTDECEALGRKKQGRGDKMDLAKDYLILYRTNVSKNQS